MRGTMRTLRNEVRDQVEQAIRRIADGVARTFDVTIDVDIPRGNPVTANTPAERDLAAEAVVAAGLTLRRDMAPAMTGEDFAWYLQQRPGRLRLDRQWPVGRRARAAQRQLRLQRRDPAGCGRLSGRSPSRRWVSPDPALAERRSTHYCNRQQPRIAAMADIPAGFLDLLTQKEGFREHRHVAAGWLATGDAGLVRLHQRRRPREHSQGPGQGAEHDGGFEGRDVDRRSGQCLSLHPDPRHGDEGNHRRRDCAHRQPGEEISRTRTSIPGTTPRTSG